MANVLEIADEAAIGAFDNRGDFERTTTMYVVNNVPTAAIKICFMQAKCSMQLPAPYISDTGTFVAATNLPAGQNINVDPWDAGGRNAPIAATSGSCRLTVVLAPGVEQDIPLNGYAEAGEGNYYPSMGWAISAESAVTVKGEKVEVLRVKSIPAGAKHIAAP